MTDPERVHILIPHLIPPSVNQYKTPYKRTLSDGREVQKFKIHAEAIAFKQAVAIFARGATIAPATKVERDKIRYEVSIFVVLGKGDRLDTDNAPKLCIDGLEDAGVIHSDARVRKVIIEKEDQDRANPRTEITVSIWSRPNEQHATR